MNRKLKEIQFESQNRMQSIVLFVRQDPHNLEVSFKTLADELMCTIEEISYEHPSLASPEAMVRIPTLILLDAQTPPSSELAVGFLKRMRHDPRLIAIPMVVVTVPDQHEIQIHLSHLGSDDFIDLSAPLEVMISRVRAQLRHSLAAQRLERVAIERDLFAAGVLHDIAFTKNNIVDLCKHVQSLIDKDLSGSIPDIKSSLNRLKEIGSGLGIYASDVIQSLKDGTRQPKVVPTKISSILDWYRQTQLGESKEKGSHIEFEFQQSGEEPEFLADLSFLKVVVLNIVKIFTDLLKDENNVIKFIVKQEKLVGLLGSHKGIKICRSRLLCERHALNPHAFELLMNIQQGFYSDYHGNIVSWALARKVVQKIGGSISLDRLPPSNHVPFYEGISIELDFPDAVQ